VVAKNKLSLEAQLNSGDAEKVAEALLYISYNINDVEWAEKQFMRMSSNHNDDIAGLALTCLGHIARVNGRISKDIVIPFLEEKIKNSNKIISSRAEDALDDIKMFT